MKNFFSRIISDQRQELNVQDAGDIIQREAFSSISAGGDLIKIVLGVRRSGKSTFCFQLLKGLPFAYLNFDDERLTGITSDDLNDILECLYREYGNFTTLFLDEIQNVEKWSLFVNRLKRQKIKLILTGSNSRLLSRELATHLTGRYESVEIFPFSFSEFLLYRGKKTISGTTRNKGNLYKLYQEYLFHGGFPEAITSENPVKYAQNLFNAILTRDVMFRYNIRHKRTFREIALSLISNYSREISYNNLKNRFDIGSEHTVKNYINYLEEAYLIMTLNKFSFKRAENLKYRKVYAVDLLFATAMSDDFSQNTGWFLENLVFLELKRRCAMEGTEVYYYKKNIEVDFVIRRNRKITELIQVCASLSDPKTLKREINALVQGSAELAPDKLLIITNDEERIITRGEKVIRCIPIIDWLLNK